MNGPIEAFDRIAPAPVADAVDEVCGHLGSRIEPRIPGQRLCRPAATLPEAAPGEVVAPKDRAAEVPQLAQEVDTGKRGRARLIVAERSRRQGLTRYGRI